jgi:two-component system, cell cycle sensor histidine kinase and response regulator CckA
MGLLRRRAILPRHLAANLDANPRAAGATAAILVVDDERAVRGVVVRLLQRGGYETAEAPDAETALSILGSEPRRFGLVITDDRMPGMSGYELVAVITRIHPHLRIVLMSGYTDAAESVGVQAGMVGMLPKPFHAAGLLSVVSDALAKDRPGAVQ